MKKELREVIKRAEKQGWRVELRQKSVFFFSPDGVTTVSTHYTPSDGRHAWKNFISNMRNGGYKD